MNPPHGLTEIFARFGDPGQPGWADENIVLFNLPFAVKYESVLVRRSRCHRLMVPVFTAALGELKDRGLDEYVRTYGGIYAHRPVRGAQKMSTHAWGISVDINPERNGLGSLGTQHPGVIAVLCRHGFQWGGLFSRKDPMHFQFCSGY